MKFCFPVGYTSLSCQEMEEMKLLQMWKALIYPTLLKKEKERRGKVQTQLI